MKFGSQVDQCEMLPVSLGTGDGRRYGVGWLDFDSVGRRLSARPHPRRVGSQPLFSIVVVVCSCWIVQQNASVDIWNTSHLLHLCWFDLPFGCQLPAFLAVYRPNIQAKSTTAGVLKDIGLAIATSTAASVLLYQVKRIRRKKEKKWMNEGEKRRKNSLVDRPSRRVK